jgi:ubiquitin-protein ligase
MSTVRLKRLFADYEKLKAYVQQHPRLELVQTQGDPPERYQIEYQIRGLRQNDDELVESHKHLVEIALPVGYPRTPPQCRMLTPVFHPNIAPHAICIGDHWSPGEPLVSIVARIGELIAYQSYNTRSPLNGEAARWVADHLEELPLDAVSMVVDQSDVPVPLAPTPPLTTAPEPLPPPPSEVPPAAPSAERVLACPRCNAKLRFTPRLAGKKVACPRCTTQMQFPLA